MTLVVRVAGGTGAGSRRPLQDPHPMWRCGNGHENFGRWVRCMHSGCNEPRR